MAKKGNGALVGIPDFGEVTTPSGQEIKKRCLTCKYATTDDQKYIYCSLIKCQSEKYSCCSSYELHPKYNKIGVSRGRVKEAAYFKWKLSIVTKFTKGMNTNWDAYNEYLEKLGGKSCLYDYWLNNIKNK